MLKSQPPVGLYRDEPFKKVIKVNGASLIAQLVKNLPAMKETWVQFLGWEVPLEKEMVNPLQYSCLENPLDRGAW